MVLYLRNRHNRIFLLLNSMQENFSKAQRFNNAHAMALKGYSLPGQPTVMKNITKKFAKMKMNEKQPVMCAGFPCDNDHYHDDGYYASDGYLRDNNGYYATDGYGGVPDYRTKNRIHVHERYCTPNEGCDACDVQPNVDGKVINFNNGRQYNFPRAIRKIAGGGIEHFEGKIDDSKYGDYGTSMRQPVETFCPGVGNARMMGAMLDVSWASGTTDGVKRANVQPFNPKRYQQGFA